MIVTSELYVLVSMIKSYVMKAIVKSINIFKNEVTTFPFCDHVLLKVLKR